MPVKGDIVMWKGFKQERPLSESSPKTESIMFAWVCVQVYICA